METRQAMNLPLIYTSSKTQINIEQIVTYIISQKLNLNKLVQYNGHFKHGPIIYEYNETSLAANSFRFSRYSNNSFF